MRVLRDKFHFIYASIADPVLGNGCLWLVPAGFEAGGSQRRSDKMGLES